MPRMIVCPECAKLVPMYRSGCVRCSGAGTIPDHRAPTANDRAVERIKRIPWEDDGEAAQIIRIIHEEAGARPNERYEQAGAEWTRAREAWKAFSGNDPDAVAILDQFFGSVES